jgi:hypothetical protein
MTQRPYLVKWITQEHQQAVVSGQDCDLEIYLSSAPTKLHMRVAECDDLVIAGNRLEGGKGDPQRLVLGRIAISADRIVTAERIN